MLHERAHDAKKTWLIAVIAGGAVAGGGYLAYRWWVKRPTRSDSKLSTEGKETKETANVSQQSPKINCPATEKEELLLSSTKKENVFIPADTTSELSTSGTFEKIQFSTFPEPDSFVQLSLSSIQDTETIPKSSLATELPHPDDNSSVELLSASSASFVTISPEISLPAESAAASPGLSTFEGKREGLDDARVTMEEKNDIVHVEKSSDPASGDSEYVQVATTVPASPVSAAGGEPSAAGGEPAVHSDTLPREVVAQENVAATDDRNQDTDAGVGSSTLPPETVAFTAPEAEQGTSDDTLEYSISQSDASFSFAASGIEHIVEE